MDYEKKYNEALSRARKLYERGTITESLGHVFPELKESDDERIRKEIIDFLISTNKYGSNEKCESWLAWLEKQCETFTKKDVDDAYLEGMVCAKNELEKQDEQKPNPYTGTSFEYNGHTFGMCARDNGVEILFDGELKAFLSSEKSFIYPIHPQPSLIPKAAQETTNKTKVEPKFHEGDWVVYKNDICQIVKREEGCNKLVTVFGIEKELVNERNLSTARLWTIQDAKDGDVLIGKIDGDEYITPFKCIKDGWLETYGYYYYAFDRFCPTQLFCREGEGTLFPATREQCDLLFAKMKEAGYEWDAEKKELKIKLKEPDVYEYELERIVDKLNEVIGKLGDIHQVLSKPFQFPYKDYTPPQEPWYKTHGVEKVTPVTCETNNEVKAKDNESK